MKNLWILVFVCAISCSTPQEDPYAACVPEVSMPDNPVLIDGFFEGDILPDKNFNKKGFVTSESSRLWPKGVVHYYFAPTQVYEGNTYRGFNKEEQSHLDNFILQMGLETGIQFIKYETRNDLLRSSKNGLIIRPSFGGSSHLGMQGGLQNIFFVYGLPENNRKGQKRVVLHELGHALGLHHEFTRPDRDDYLIVLYENIYERLHPQFNVRQGIACGPTLDLESVMMYDSYAGTKNELPVMTTIDGEELEINYELSPGDIRTLQALYSVEINKRNKTK
jgi:hypothetical protein